MPHILLEEAVDDPKGIFIGCGIKIQCSPQEILYRIGDKELFGCGGVPADIEKDATDPVAGHHWGVIDGAGLIGMFKGHFIGILPELVKAIGADGLVADIDPGIEPGEVDIDPIGVFGSGIEKARIPDDGRIGGIFKCVGESRLVKGLILVWREVYFEISFSFGCIYAVAGRKGCSRQESGDDPGQENRST